MPWRANNAKHAEAGRVQASLLVVKAEDLDLPKDAPSNVAFIGMSTTAEGVVKQSTDQEPAAVHPARESQVEVTRLATSEELDGELLFCRTYPQFLISAKSGVAQVPDGCIALDEAARLNFEVTDGAPFDWTCFNPEKHGGSPAPLISVTMEVKPRYAMTEKETEEAVHVVIDTADMSKWLCKNLWESVVTVHEHFLVRQGDREFTLRVTSLQSDVEDSDELEVADDDHRGVWEANTVVYLTKHPSPLFADSFDLDKVVTPAQRPAPSTMVNVYCDDGEWFPVKKKLLLPCIALNKAVMDKSNEEQNIHVEMDCCMFDRVLLYLLDEARGKGESHQLEAESVHDLLTAAKSLGVMGLEQICLKFLGAFKSRVRRLGIRWSEVVERVNTKDEVLIVIDGMVMDVTRWLIHHPGGNIIIPEQAVLLDGTVYFEIYHASRTSFLLLKQFYIGDVVHEDLHLIPPAPRGSASEPFLQQLREFCAWRVPPEETVHASF